MYSRRRVPVPTPEFYVFYSYEKGEEILARCKALLEYSRFIHMIRSSYEETGNMTAAIEESIQRCQREGVLTDFLKRNGGDLVSVLYEALTTEECLSIREEDGYCRGMEEGEIKSKIVIAANMLRKGISKTDIAEMTGLSEEEVDAL